MARLEDIDERATAWLAQRDSGNWSEADESALQAWLGAAAAHRVAFLRLERIWEEAGRLKVLAAGRPAGAVPPPDSWQTPFFTSRLEGANPLSVSAGAVRPRTVGSGRRWLRFATAASLALGVALGAWYYLAPRGNEYRTPLGEVASVPLPDGSNITLNTATEVRVNLTPEQRRVDLKKGEAFFSVAKDPNRPFVVEAGHKRVVAVGTQFSVRREGDNVEVVVTEGVVRLENAKSAQGSAPGSAVPESSRLAAGAIARVTGDDVLIEERSLPEAEAALSWREGYLTFHETTLADAVAEFNRYNEKKLRIDDPKVAGIRISGTFRPTNAEAFVRLLKDGFSIRSDVTDESITLTQN